ncbi:GNAT family N-acetyltransferase [Xylanimonas ulmi]|uniref:Ribosomal protein S18 acetylase RimI-like enzyme n=1 Tax=Xylanimonas ulmi TaxID=228973 RepID=A0A4Q7M5L7_9MICO|nr:GNAT family N-acetyltransferase [Xylanibacterium ulmi]RZS62277.1 ribosomal protein S18 acetylase RimI-like enzyme [Xylanibacterium ulmi]
MTDDGVVRADEHCVEVVGASAAPGATSDVVGGLVAGLVRGPLRILTGVACGPVRVALSARPHPAEDPDPGWEDVAEVSVLAGSRSVLRPGPVTVADPGGRAAAGQERLDAFGPGWYRLRVHARGRDRRYDHVVEDPVEEYLVVAWPQAEPQPARPVAVGSRTARGASRTWPAVTARGALRSAPSAVGERAPAVTSRPDATAPDATRDAVARNLEAMRVRSSAMTDTGHRLLAQRNLETVTRRHRTPAPLRVRELSAQDAPLAQALLVWDPGYSERVTGAAPAPSDGERLFAARPPGVGADAKAVLGFFDDASPRDGQGLVALVDLVRGYPAPDVAFIGLLMVDGRRQGRGYGRAAYLLAEDHVRRAWPEVRTLRLAIVDTNAPGAVPFWESFGFRATGQTKAFDAGLATTARLYELRIR